MNHPLVADMKSLFAKHGTPTSEDPAWATVIRLQVLQMEVLEKIMNTLQDLATAASNEAAALVDLNSSVAAAVAAGLGSGGGPSGGGTFLAPSDQTSLDTSVSTVNSNIEKIGEIKALLSQVGTIPPVAPSGAAPSPPPAAPSVSGAGQVSPSSTAAL